MKIKIPPGWTDDPAMDADRYFNWLEDNGRPINEEHNYEEDEDEEIPLCWREEAPIW